jgi:hypothetical protein
MKLIGLSAISTPYSNASNHKRVRPDKPGIGAYLRSCSLPFANPASRIELQSVSSLHRRRHWRAAWPALPGYRRCAERGVDGGFMAVLQPIRVVQTAATENGESNFCVCRVLEKVGECVQRWKSQQASLETLLIVRGSRGLLQRRYGAAVKGVGVPMCFAVCRLRRNFAG